MKEDLICPRCGYRNKRPEHADSEIAEVGKTVIDCQKCKKYFVLRDEGDGEFICF